jgi:toxin ParE1/3/4
MYKVELSPQAEADLLRICSDIAAAGFPMNADRFTRRLYDFCQSLRLAPRMGNKRPNVAPELLVVGYRRQATICYMVDELTGTITILRVLRRGQSIERAFQ